MDRYGDVFISISYSNRPQEGKKVNAHWFIIRPELKGATWGSIIQRRSKTPMAGGRGWLNGSRLCQLPWLRPEVSKFPKVTNHVMFLLLKIPHMLWSEREWLVPQSNGSTVAQSSSECSASSQVFLNFLNSLGFSSCRQQRDRNYSVTI